MEKITAYKLSDGTITENKEEAEKKERFLFFDAQITSLIERRVGYSEYQDTVKSFIVENSDALLSILKGLKQ